VLVHLVNGWRADAEFGGSRTIGSAGASPARAFRSRCTSAIVGSSLTSTSKTLDRGGILADSIGSHVHLPLSVNRLGKDGRHIGLPEIDPNVIVMTDGYALGESQLLRVTRRGRGVAFPRPVTWRKTKPKHLFFRKR
jgi:hypothetical protein